MRFSKPIRVVLVLAAFIIPFNPAYSSAFQEIAGQGHTSGSVLPIFENRIETDHFILKWTNRSSHSKDNISDPRVIRETSQYLETAWEKYTTLFGRSPYTAPGRNKIEVIFSDIDCYGIADPPNGPIQFNSHAWMKEKGIRQPTSAHELFHKMQYAFGYKTQWKPQRPFTWFTEGTAAWAEVYVWGRVSRTCKVDEIFKDTKMDLYDAEDMAMPFWIYFVQGNRGKANDQLMVKLFERAEQLQNERQALNQVIQEAYGSVDLFFASFSKDRKKAFWGNSCVLPYKCILGPDGKDLVEQVKSIQRRG
ncbi:MAG: hypothetical protein AB9866_01750 [Syntrophobacteraceae bacterium]